MREFRIIFAQEDASGIVRRDIAETLGRRIAGAYGGFTLAEGSGGYIMADGRLVLEPVFIFDIATDSDASSVSAFVAMVAEIVRREMDQESVYFRNIDGGVRIMAEKGIAA